MAGGLATPYYDDIVSIRVKILSRDPPIPERPQRRRLGALIDDIPGVSSEIVAPRSIQVIALEDVEFFRASRRGEGKTYVVAR